MRRLCAWPFACVFCRIAGHLCARFAKGTPHHFHFSATFVAEVSTRGVCQIARQQTGAVVEHSGAQWRDQKESAVRPGPGSSRTRRQWLCPFATRIDSLVPSVGAQPGRRLCHDRRLCLFAQPNRRPKRSGHRGPALPRCASSHQPRGRGVDQITGTNGGLLQAPRLGCPKLHHRWVFQNRRPGFALARWPTQDHGSVERAIQNQQRQIRRPSAHRKQNQRPSHDRTVHGVGQWL